MIVHSYYRKRKQVTLARDLRERMAAENRRVLPVQDTYPSGTVLVKHPTIPNCWVQVRAAD